MSRYWYSYTAAPGSENIVGSYLRSPNKPQIFCPNGPNLCAIYTVGGTVPDDVSDTIKNYFVLASGRQHPYPDGIGQKPYVYVKP